MNKITIYLLIISLIATSSAAMEAKEALVTNAVRVGDYLQTVQDKFGDHVAVVVKCPREATLEEAFYNQIVVAENSEGGAKLTMLGDFIINGISHNHDVAPKDKSQPFLIVARAISALFANITYDIALKNCGLFAHWCLKGAQAFPASLAIKDFRHPKCQSLGPDMNMMRHACNGTPEGKQMLVAKASKRDEGLAQLLDSLSLEYLASWGHDCPEGQENLAAFIHELYQNSGIKLTTKDSGQVAKLAEIMREALLLPKNSFELSAASLTILDSISDEQTEVLCSQIVDSDVRGDLIDLNLLLEHLN